MKPSKSKSNSSVVSEFSGVELGDRRLLERLKRIIPLLESQPDRSFPDTFEDDADLEGLYRFLENPNVNFTKLLAGHVAETVERLREYETALVVHDTTDFSFSSRRNGLGRLRRSGHGFLGHFALAVALDEQPLPLGVLGVMPWMRTKETPSARRKKGEISYTESRALPTEQARWGTLMDRVERKLSGITSVIHVMDSEADDYAGMARHHKKDQRFVIRLCYDRVLSTAEHGPKRKAKEYLASQESVCERPVRLSRRRRLPGGGRRRTEARDERDAKLCFSAAPVVLRRPLNFPGKGVPQTLSVNLVHVWEVDPPPDVEPVEWHLITTEPTETREQILRVVDIYRARWVIEMCHPRSDPCHSGFRLVNCRPRCDVASGNETHSSG